MRKVFAGVLALAAGLSMIGMGSDQASAAMRGPGVHGHGSHGPVVQAPAPRVVAPVGHRFNGHAFNGPGHHGPRHFHRGYGFRPLIVVRPPVYALGVGNGCGWLKRKAINTGSRYWWNRYNDCRWG